MVSMLTLSAVDLWFVPRSTKLVFVSSTLKHTALRRKSKDWMVWNQDNVSEWGLLAL
jgi:hypothetical protein